MSDFLVELQEKIASYPAWLVAILGGVVIALVLILLAKAFRAAAVILFFAALGVGGWLAYRAFVDPAPNEIPDPVESTLKPAGVRIAMLEQPLSCQRFPGRCNTRQ